MDIFQSYKESDLYIAFASNSLKKLKVELPYDPAVPLLGIYPEENHNLKIHIQAVFIAALFTVAKT